MILTNENLIPFNEFLINLKNTINSAFYKRDNIEKFIQKRGFPALVLRDIMATKPLSVSIPKEYGGRGVNVKEILGVLEIASYESLPLALTFGINIGLFLEPISKYAQESVKQSIFNRFLTQQNMGGLMITEPNHGSDAMNMQTYNVKKDLTYHIKGIKHWQGLTGVADYWIVTSRNKEESGKLNRDIDFFICDVHQPNQFIEVEEYFNNIGLYPITYGRNKIDIQISEQFKLHPETTGLKLMMDLLHRNRFQFPGMAIGFIKRLLDESIKQCQTRLIAGKSLLELDQVKFQIAKIQSAFTVCSAMCYRSVSYTGIDKDLSSDSVEANSIKTYITDLMHESAQTLTQLCGANGYKIENVGSRGILDSRPFQIFEGSNEMLYTQISEMVLNRMNREKISILFEFLKKNPLTDKIADFFKSDLSFSVDINIIQRKMVDIGKIISRIIAANQVLVLGNNGFRADLIQDCLDMIKYEVSILISSFHRHTNIIPIQEYKDNSSWLEITT